MLRIFFAASLLITLWLTIVLWTQENTLSLAAQDKISFSAAWGYRFRSAALLGAADENRQALKLFRPAGARYLCLLLILMHLPALLRRPPRALWVLAGCASLVSFWLFLALANPGLVFNWRRVMGGRSLFTGLGLSTGSEKILVEENCLALINPSDLNAVSSLELMDAASFRKLRPRLIDLKIVEENYRLLHLKDEKGIPVFSDAARAYATAEVAYARGLQAEIITAPDLCLIANFDILPQQETAPFSRARKIVDTRRKAGKDTKVIQLPAGAVRR